MSTRIAFIGLGAMGSPMAARLAGKGHELVVLDSDLGRARAFGAQHGCAVAGTPAEAAAGAGVVVTMLPTSSIVETVLCGDDGALKSLEAGAIIAEMSSGDPTRTLAIAAEVAGAGGQLVDAPVSGGVRRAETGDLAIMVGGDDEVIRRVEPYLACMGTNILRTGAVGTAHAMKALNNLASAGGLLIAVEVLLIGRRFGIDADTIVDILNVSTGMNNATRNKLKQFIVSESYNSGFGLDLLIKDLGIALDVARDVNVPAPFSALCRELFAASGGLLGPGRDHTEIARLSEIMAGRAN